MFHGPDARRRVERRRCLWALQEMHGFLPAGELRQVSERLGVPLYRLHGVASFVPHFRLTPPPAVDVLVCDDMTCHLRDGATVLRGLEGALDLLLPSIATCRDCHGRPAGARVECVECHVYHDKARDRGLDGPFGVKELLARPRR